jgi:hypothetical protein
MSRRQCDKLIPRELNRQAIAPWDQTQITNPRKWLKNELGKIEYGTRSQEYLEKIAKLLNRKT